MRFLNLQWRVQVNRHFDPGNKRSEEKLNHVTTHSFMGYYKLRSLLDIATVGMPIQNTSLLLYKRNKCTHIKWDFSTRDAFMMMMTVSDIKPSSRAPHFRPKMMLRRSVMCAYLLGNKFRSTENDRSLILLFTFCVCTSEIL